MNDVECLLATFRAITETESVEHIWKDGIYQGCSVTYRNLTGLFKTMFHPYIPLIIHGQPSPAATEDYFRQHGWPVPPKNRHC